MSAAMRPGSPLARSGPRRLIAVSAAAAAAVARISAELGITQRIVADAVLEDSRLVRRQAQRALSRIKPKPRGGVRR